MGEYQRRQGGLQESKYVCQAYGIFGIDKANLCVVVERSPVFKPDARGIWNGDLPPRNYTNPRFSLKIFVGGVPWDVSEDTLMNAFRPYGVSHVEWPGQSPRSSKGRGGGREEKKPTGYVYVVFKSELSISFLLADCIQSCHASPGELYFSMKTGPCLKDFRQFVILPEDSFENVQLSVCRCKSFLGCARTLFTGRHSCKIFDTTPLIPGRTRQIQFSLVLAWAHYGFYSG
uniref:RRM domain-containing protein n=1 Tax=Ditylenchus dipsaci TaxID=166011 RepID=A0A915CYN3_9BILA